jgi:hypothetical protein
MKAEGHKDRLIADLEISFNHDLPDLWVMRRVSDSVEFRSISNLLRLWGGCPDIQAYA